jgi:lipopolysaccharide transport system ATP-binding protein
MRPAIEVSGLSKRYVIEHESRHDNLRDTLHHTARKLWRRFRWGTGFTKEEFWALRDVSFSVQPGEVVGIIGRNGAGKSTLLKILSRITEATSGKVTLRGRVASLLEVGTGFHPDLTGRENIFLNGAILGMSRAEIRRKFDAIVAFAEIERFLDTPVKRYSSGMYVRLAFAVAAHLEPEILIIDEVLAVGDASFQKKCLGKMRSVARDQGRTVLFVSHQLAAIRQLCSRTILLAQGRTRADGPTACVLNMYSNGPDTGPAPLPVPSADQAQRAYVRSLTLEDLDGRAPSLFRVGEPWRVRLEVKTGRPLRGFVVGLGLITSEGVGLQTSWTEPQDIVEGVFEFVFTQKHVCLAADSYRLVVGLSESGASIQQFEAGRLEVTGENPLIPVVAASGYGLVLNSMQTEVRPLLTR